MSITVTKTFFPPIDEYYSMIQRIWDNKWLTNNGELTRELSEKLNSALDVKYFIPMTNGTLPIQIALHTFANENEVITTPFSYVATTSTIIWERCKPVFVDIDPQHLTIDESKIEAAITKNTTAILATHVYGNPCNVSIIAKIAERHNLKVIYDAAHCFGVKYNGESIFKYGDVSTCSFHATKLFHTGEGGCLVCNDEKVYNKLFYRHNFGHDGEIKFHGLGINAKMSELQAAMGLCVFPYIEEIISKRKNICEIYDQQLSFSGFRRLKLREGTQWNYSYYPIIFDKTVDLLETIKRLNVHNIFPRRYFYPSLENLPYIESENCPIANSIAERVLCLPLYTDLDLKDQTEIIELINKHV